MQSKDYDTVLIIQINSHFILDTLSPVFVRIDLIDQISSKIRVMFNHLNHMLWNTPFGLLDDDDNDDDDVDEDGMG
jgi:hypothetical protein